MNYSSKINKLLLLNIPTFCRSSIERGGGGEWVLWSRGVFTVYGGWVKKGALMRVRGCRGEGGGNKIHKKNNLHIEK